MRREHDRRLRDVIAVHGGQEVKALGDGFLAVFESAGAAIACAGDVQRAIDRQAHRGPVPLAVRVGIGAGDVAWEGDDVFGTPVVEAQRICAAAGPGEILVTDTVRLLAGTAVAGCARRRGRAVAAGLATSGARVAGALGRQPHRACLARSRARRRWRHRVRRARGAARRSAPGLERRVGRPLAAACS